MKNFNSAAGLLLASAFLALPARSQAPAIAWQATAYGRPAAGSAQYRVIRTPGSVVAKVDGKGNVYTSGTAFNGASFDFLTVKYDADGSVQWRAVMDERAHPQDFVRAMEIDSSGNAYVAGTSYGGYGYFYVTVKYDPLGNERWRARLPMPGEEYASSIAIGADEMGNLYVACTAGDQNLGYLVVKYDSGGAELWRRMVEAPRSNYSVAAVAVDARGNVHVTGSSLVESDDPAAMRYFGSSDYLTVKFDASGVEQWRVRTDGVAGNHDFAAAVALDSSGNVYVGGNSSNGEDYDFLTVKYDRDGAERWRAVGKGGEGSRGRLAAIAVDPQGAVVVTGSTQARGANATDFLTLKYDTLGVQQWRSAAVAAPGASASPNALALDASGNVFLAGTVYTADNGDFLTVKYDAAGVEQWRVKMNGTGNGLDEATSVAVARDGAVVIAGSSIEASTRSAEITVVKYAPSGGSMDRSAVWWGGMAENGWGVSITQHGATQFNVIYAYDGSGRPVWYAMPDATWDRTVQVYSGALYRPTSAPLASYDVSQFRPGNIVGSATLTFTDGGAILAFVIDGIPGRKALQPYAVGNRDASPYLRVSDLWWGGDAEKGWGLSIAQQAAGLFLAWFTYDGGGRTTFLTSSGGAWQGSTYRGELYSSTASPWLGAAYDASALRVRKEGSMTIDFIDADNAVMTYTIGGVNQSKRIRRFAF